MTDGMLSDFRDQFIATGTEVLKKRHPSATDTEVKRLKEKVGELTMMVELLEELKRRADPNDPFSIRRQRRYVLHTLSPSESGMVSNGYAVSGASTDRRCMHDGTESIVVSHAQVRSKDRPLPHCPTATLYP